MFNVIGLAIVIAIAALLVWLGIRARRINNSFLKWGSVGLAGLLAVAFALLSTVMIAGLYKLHSRSAPVPDVKVAGTPEQIKRGQAIADTFCGGCHTKKGTLAGGADLAKDLPIHLGSFVAANLTPAGLLKNWSDGEIFRAIRNGVDADGHLLFIMALTNAGKLSDDDTQAVIAYIRSLPATGQETGNPPDQFNLLGLTMLGAGMLPGAKPVFTGVVTAPPKGPDVKYGEYILSYQDCRECHGADLKGGVQGQLAPVGPDLNLVKDWKLEEFIATMRTGTDPNGHKITGPMPWRPIGKMDDVELTAVYEYLTHLSGPQRTAVN
jgi:mono/diheme cytochrome c family protein